MGWEAKGDVSALVVRVATPVLRFVGAFLCWVFFQSAFSWAWVFGIAGLLTGASAAVHLVRSSGWRRALGVAGIATLAPAYAFSVYAAISFGVLLAWAVPWWGIALVMVAGAASVLTWLPRPRAIRVPPSIALGTWTTLCLLGWVRGESWVQCDDYLRVQAEPNVRVQIPTRAELSACQPGQRVRIERFPRTIWQSPAGDAFVFTTQRGSRPPEGDPPRSPMSGAICSVPVDGSDAPVCVSEGKAQGLSESASLDRLFIAAWSTRTEPVGNGTIFAVSRGHPLEVLDRVDVDWRTGELFYDPDADLIGALTDEGEVMIPIQASTLKKRPSVEMHAIPGDIVFDPERHQGVYCYSGGPMAPIQGQGYLSVAFRSQPYTYRALGPSGEYPWVWLAAVWGCDWNPRTGDTYVAVANYGLLAKLDYDSGRVDWTRFVGFGQRTVTVHPDGRHVYLGDFLRGVVSELDTRSHDIVRQWFVGHYVRGVTVSRDTRALFVSSSLGIVRIDL